VRGFGKWKLQNEGYQGNSTISDRRTEDFTSRNESVTIILMSREVEVGLRVKSIAGVSTNRIKGNSLVLLQFDCRTVYNKAI